MAKIEIKQNLVKGRSRKKKVVDSSAVDDDIMAMFEMQEENENKIEKKTKRNRAKPEPAIAFLTEFSISLRSLTCFANQKIT